MGRSRRSIYCKDGENIPVNHNLALGDAVTFSDTGNGPPTGSGNFNTSDTFFVVGTVGSTTFQLSTSSGGSPIIGGSSTGNQSDYAIASLVGSEDLWTTSSAHGLEVNDAIMFTESSTINIGNNYKLYKPYFVANVPTTTTVTLSDTYGGTPAAGNRDSPSGFNYKAKIGDVSGGVWSFDMTDGPVCLFDSGD